MDLSTTSFMEKTKLLGISEITYKRWSEMTEENQHLAVRIEIAKTFGLDVILSGPFAGMDFVDAFKTAKYLRELTGRENVSLECIATRAMFYEIEKRYGTEIMEKVRECL